MKSAQVEAAAMQLQQQQQQQQYNYNSSSSSMEPNITLGRLPTHPPHLPHRHDPALCVREDAADIPSDPVEVHDVDVRGTELRRGPLRQRQPVDLPAGRTGRRAERSGGARARGKGVGGEK
jgi:hypothetical protein